MKPLLLLLTLTLAGCGAFADATDPDGGTPDAGPTLKIQPQYIKPGQFNAYELTFTLGPPWKKEDCKYTYVNKLDMRGTDIEPTTHYSGGSVITATLNAKINAAAGERFPIAEVACEKPGQPQRTHSEWGRFYVLDRDQADGGSQ